MNYIDTYTYYTKSMLTTMANEAMKNAFVFYEAAQNWEGTYKHSPLLQKAEGAARLAEAYFKRASNR
jgi:hypothetical protein